MSRSEKHNQSLIPLYAVVGIFVSSLLAACEAKPAVTTTIGNCGGEAEVDVAPGELQKILAPNIEFEFIVNDNGSITYYSSPKFTDFPPSVRHIGDLDSGIDVDLEGDTNKNGKQNIIFKSDCPAPTPTFSPITPTGLLKGNARSLAQVDQGFHPGNASKPARNFPIYRRG